MRIVWFRGKWYATWTEGGQTRRLSLRTADRGAAERALRDLQSQPAGDTVGAIMAAYFTDLVARGRPDTRARDAWKALEGAFGNMRPDQIDPPLCRSYAQSRRGMGRKNGTVAKELGILRSGLRWHDRATPAKIEMPPSPPPRDRYLTRAERDALVAAAETPHIRLFVEVAIATAARAQAVLDLTWTRVEFDRGQIRLATGESGKKGRATVPMTKRVRKALEEAHKVATTPYVIEYAGRKVGSVKKGFARACIKAGLAGVSPHTLRHTAAVWMAEAGRPMDEIAQYLGHSDPRVTYRVYARFSPDYLRGAADALE